MSGPAAGGSIAPRNGEPRARRLSGSVDLDSNTLLIVAVLIVGLVGVRAGRRRWASRVRAGFRPAGEYPRRRGPVDRDAHRPAPERTAHRTGRGRWIPRPRRRIAPRCRRCGSSGSRLSRSSPSSSCLGSVVATRRGSSSSVSRAHSPTPARRPRPQPRRLRLAALGLAESFVRPGRGQVDDAGPDQLVRFGRRRRDRQVRAPGERRRRGVHPVALPSATRPRSSPAHRWAKLPLSRPARRTGRAGGAWVNGPTWKPGRLQDASTSVKYKGSWITKSNTSASGGTHRYATSSSARASITGSFRDVGWVATRPQGRLGPGPDRRGPGGDHRPAVLDDELSADRLQPPLRDAGTHTIEIRPIGGGPIYLDAFLVMR